MHLVFVSNILNHHQRALCEAFQREFDEFSFIATDENKAFGYQKAQEEKYVLHYYDLTERTLSMKYILEAEVVIFGSCPNELIHMRMEKNKLSFLYTERFLKKGVWRRYIPRTRKKMMERVGQYKNSNMYVLCASAYTAYDLSLLGFPVEKCFKWGYFPIAKKYEIEDLLKAKKSEKRKILWVGRMLKWKHPELIIKLADKLRNEGYDFEVTMVGDGELMSAIKKEIKRKKLEEHIRLCGAKSADEVRNYMEKAEIFITTSDFYEGWGAVLNEAMNSGCVVIASHAAGSTPYLIQNDINGCIFESKNIKMLFEKTTRIMKEDIYRYEMQLQAYRSIINIWNADNAAKNFKIIVENLIEKKEETIEEGPCSQTPLLKNGWYKKV